MKYRAVKAGGCTVLLAPYRALDFEASKVIFLEYAAPEDAHTFILIPSLILNAPWTFGVPAQGIPTYSKKPVMLGNPTVK